MAKKSSGWAAQQAKAEVNRNRNSQLLASYAAKGPSKGVPHEQVNSGGLGSIGAGLGGALGIGGSPLGGGASPAAQPEDGRNTAYYNTVSSIAGSTRDNALADNQYDVGTGANQLGFQWDPSKGYDPMAAATAGVDPSNPFSKMALLQHSYEQQKAGTSNSYAAMGQHRSGAYQRMQKENQFQNDASTQALRDAFQALIEQGKRGSRDATKGYNDSISQAAYSTLTQNLG